MFKPTKMLKVVSVIMLIFAVIGLISVVFSMAMIPKIADMPGVDTSMLMSALTPLNIAISLISSASCIAAAILGICGKSYKAALIAMGLYTLLIVISAVQSIVGGTFTFISVVGYILPVLYWWGLYQSKE